MSKHEGVKLPSSTSARPSIGWTKFGDLQLDDSMAAVHGGYDNERCLSYPLQGSSSTSPVVAAMSLHGSESPVQPWHATSVDPSEQSTLETVQEVELEDSNFDSPLRRSISQNISVTLPASTLTHPRSCYDGFEPGNPETKEHRAIAELLYILRQENPDLGDFIEFELNDFTVYIDSSIYPNELRPLHHLATRAASDKFYFDGVLTVGGNKYYVRKVPFRELPIGNYGTSEPSVDDQIWIRSEHNQRRNMEIYYKFGRPSLEYERFWFPFLWIADLSKHVVDYATYLLEKKHRAWLHEFRQNFSKFLVKRHHDNEAFQGWYAAHGSEDFRTAITANIDFIWKEALGQPDKKIALWHGFWGELKGSCYDPMQSVSLSDLDGDRATEDSAISTGEGTKRKDKAWNNESVPKTVVTPYIYDLFSHMGFDTIMKSLSPTGVVQSCHARQIEATKAQRQTFCQGRNQVKDDRAFIASIVAGDVISTPPDDENTGTEWKRESSRHHGSDHVWYARVQKVHVSPKGRRSFDVIWMYQSRDTPCALMKYPWSNELFLSDSCSCETRCVDEREVIATHRVAWFGNPSTTESDLFVRQTYLIEEKCWIALNENHLVCDHHKTMKHRGIKSNYKHGDTVLVKLATSARLDPFIVGGIYKEDEKRWVRLRKLLRRVEVDQTGRPLNELVYTDQLVTIEANSIVRPCMIRAFLPGDNIPSPYDRGGTGDAFYLTHQQLQNSSIEPLQDLRGISFQQGFLMSNTIASDKLRGLDLFCGGGNFGRGIEDGGGIAMKWANDISPNAIHSYMANCEAYSCTPFLGSVDVLLERALTGYEGVPRPGDVQFISGGSPCQGFSRLTMVENQKTMKQKKNRSLVASFASFVDYYRPQYGLLENVQTMVKALGKREECFFSQLVCSIVGLGYQVRIIYADAWAYGSSQSRSRVFLSFAAPGVPMPNAPSPTHSHPPGIRVGSLGKMSNGKPFGERINTPTPFKFVSSFEAAGDLPDIRDGKADYCVGFPDHRLSIGFTPRIRQQLRLIPLQPFGMSFDKARFGYLEDGKRILGSITPADVECYFPNPKEQRMQAGTKGWGRVHPHGMFRTVVTACGPTDRRTGFVNHWQQPRPLSVLEVRRAQGFLDHEVITGKPAQQWHVVGNSVARHVALALGLAIREAWFGTLHEEASLETIGIASVDDLMDRGSTVDAMVSSDDLEAGFDISGQSVQDLLFDVLGEPASTPAASVSDPTEERPDSGTYGHKRQSSQLEDSGSLAKRPRWPVPLLC